MFLNVGLPYPVVVVLAAPCPPDTGKFHVFLCPIEI